MITLETIEQSMQGFFSLLPSLICVYESKKLQLTKLYDLGKSI